MRACLVFGQGLRLGFRREGLLGLCFAPGLGVGGYGGLGVGLWGVGGLKCVGTW